MRKLPSPTGDRLISGKLRAKAARGGAEGTVLRVDELDYVWSLRHSWYVRGFGLKAFSTSVCKSPGRTRELVLEFALKADDADGPTSLATLLSAVEAGVRAAREAGWDPESRGRSIRFVAGDLEGEATPFSPASIWKKVR